MPDDLQSCELAELVCTRLSHDLIGNIGAVANAVEILDDDPEGIADIKPILDISAHTLTARLKFFRLAFGLSNAAPKNIDEIRQIASGYISTIGSRQTPITLEMTLNTPALYKIVLLSVMTLADTFIRGGNLKISESAHGLTVTASSSSALSEGKLKIIQETLSGKYPDDNPSQMAPLIFLKQMLKLSPVKISVEFSGQQAVLQIA